MVQPTIRPLEVSVTPLGPARWKWYVSEGDTEIACGFEGTREAAQIEGDCALFALLKVKR